MTYIVKSSCPDSKTKRFSTLYEAKRYASFVADHGFIGFVDRAEGSKTYHIGSMHLHGDGIYWNSYRLRNRYPIEFSFIRYYNPSESRGFL